MRGAWRGVVLACLLAACWLGPVACQGSYLVLRRDWVSTKCAAGACTTQYPDVFTVGGLYLSDSAGPAAQAGCEGKGGLRKESLDAAGLDKQELECAWQNVDPAVKRQESWKAQWDTHGKCTAVDTAELYLKMGLDLDKQYPLPQDLQDAVDRDQLQAAILTGFGAAPYITCNSDKQLQDIQLCFDPASQALVDCPWGPLQECAGELSVPRSGRGPGDCATYYQPSPVILAGSTTMPAAPEAAPPAADVGSPPAPPAEPAEPAAVPAEAPQQLLDDSAAVAPPLPPPEAPQELAAIIADGGEAAAGTPMPSEPGAAAPGSSEVGSDEAAAGAPIASEAEQPAFSPSDAATETVLAPAPVPAESQLPAPVAEAGSSTQGDVAQQVVTDTSSVGISASGSSANGSTTSGNSTNGSGNAGGSSGNNGNMALGIGAGVAAGLALGLAGFGIAYYLYNRRSGSKTASGRSLLESEKYASSGPSSSSNSSSGGGGSGGKPLEVRRHTSRLSLSPADGGSFRGRAGMYIIDLGPEASVTQNPLYRTASGGGHSSPQKQKQSRPGLVRSHSAPGPRRQAAAAEAPAVRPEPSLVPAAAVAQPLGHMPMRGISGRLAAVHE